MHIHALDAYRSRVSLVHRLDARVKLILAVFFIVATALTPDGAWLAYALLAGLLLGVVVASRLGVVSVPNMMRFWYFSKNFRAV